MPSLEHETLVELFSRDPRTAVSLLAATNQRRIPPHDSVEVRPADERELTPASLRVDVVVLLVPLVEVVGAMSGGAQRGGLSKPPRWPGGGWPLAEERGGDSPPQMLHSDGGDRSSGGGIEVLEAKERSC